MRSGAAESAMCALGRTTTVNTATCLDRVGRPVRGSAVGACRAAASRRVDLRSCQNYLMRDLILRPAKLRDSMDVLELWAVAAENTGRPTDSLNAIESLIDRDPDALILASVSGQIVGSVIAGWDGWRFHLYRLAVHPGHRR